MRVRGCRECGAAGERVADGLARIIGRRRHPPANRRASARAHPSLPPVPMLLLLPDHRSLMLDVFPQRTPDHSTEKDTCALCPPRPGTKEMGISHCCLPGNSEAQQPGLCRSLLCSSRSATMNLILPLLLAQEQKGSAQFPTALRRPPSPRWFCTVLHRPCPLPCINPPAAQHNKPSHRVARAHPRMPPQHLPTTYRQEKTPHYSTTTATQLLRSDCSAT